MKELLDREDVIALIRKLIEQEGSQTAAARKMGTTPQVLTNVLSGFNNPGPAILNYFGLERIVLYRYK